MINVEIIRSARRTLAIEIRSHGKVFVRAPFWVSKSVINRFVSEKEGWILKKNSELENLPVVIKPTSDELCQMRKRVRRVIDKRLPFWVEKTGLVPNGIKITSARKRFGSCSSKGNICFSLYLDSYDEDLVDFVIVHELCHLKVMNHSAEFYSLVDEFLPDWREREKRLINFHRMK